MPSNAITKNQPSITGPNILPMKPVPFRCMTKSPIRTMRGRGTTAGARARRATRTPSSARRIGLQAFKGAEQGEAGRDGAVAVEQRRAYKADDQKLRTPRSRLGVAGG